MSVESQVYIWTVGKHADPQAVDAQLSAQSAPHGVSVKSEGLANWNLCQGFARIAATESGEEQKNPLILFMRDMVKRKLGSGMVVPSTVRTIALSRNLDGGVAPAASQSLTRSMPCAPMELTNNYLLQFQLGGRKN
ncbi:hypothetical protein [Rhizobium leguminosarum]|uniref:hypothetical protein n=1 Tax=Rhizobium leguminosarum TaxID=384 RepID=UPI0010320608|nr:hypothetical protein [Rhizobium leguminosarum]TAU13432.1 hypothetical protein ELI50_35675 [Rhizobium leguminosarum]WSH29622.1 hypothetical protein U8P75_24865 [Rhizobium beringeri]